MKSRVNIDSNCSLPPRSSGGFTLVETIITLSIVAIISVSVLIALAPRRNSANLDSATRQMVTLLREAQGRASAGESSASWGVRFGNLTSTTPFYSLFTNSYSTSSRVSYYSLPPNVSFSTSSIAQGASLDITFAALTGLPSAAASLDIVLSNGAGGVIASDTITVSSQGLVSF